MKSKKKQEKIPQVGDTIYVNSSFHISMGSMDVVGGKATVSKVTEGISGGEKCIFVEVKEHPNKGYNWSQFLSKEQEKLKKKFGQKCAYPDPDIDTPWIEDGDWVSLGGEPGHKYHGPGIW